MSSPLTYMILLVITAALVPFSPAGADEKKGGAPDKTVDIKLQDGKTRYLEQEKNTAEPLAVVVGETVRWRNRDRIPHSATSDRKVDEKPLFDTGEIEPGKHKDILFDINIYENAGGKRAGFVRIPYHSIGQPGVKGEIILLSAAKR